MSNIRLQCVDGSGNPVFLVNDSGIVTASTAQLTNMNLTTQTVGTSLITTSIIATGNSNTIGSLISTGGNMGIGITTPSGRLDIRATSEASGALIAQFGGSSNPRIQFYDDQSATAGPRMFFNAGNPSIIEALGNIAILPTSNVGVSVRSPQNTLDIDGVTSIRNGNGSGGSDRNQIVLGYNGSTDYAHAIKTRHQAGLNNSDNAIDFYAWQTSDAVGTVGSKHLMSITSVGVGIGTQYPSGTLHAKTTAGTAIAIDSAAASNSLLEFHSNGTRRCSIYRRENSDDLRVGMDSVGADVMTFATNGNIGVMNNSPRATLDIATSNTFGQLFLGNSVQNRKLVLWDGTGNDHQFYGFGINNGTLRYQIEGSSTVYGHIFYAGSSATTSTELMRIRGDGNVGIGTNSPSFKLQINGGPGVQNLDSGSGDITIPYGSAIRVTGDTITNTKLMEVQWNGSYDETRIYAPGSAQGGDTPKIRIQNDGYIGINTTSPGGGPGLDVRGIGTFGISTAGSISLPLTLTNYNVNYGSAMGFVAGQGNQWTRLYDYNINNFGNNFTLDMTCQNSTYTSVLWANNWNGNRVIGINKQWPDYTLDIAGHLNVNGSALRTVKQFGYLDTSGTVGGIAFIASTGGNVSYSIYASNRVAATEYNAYSDQRIKMDIEEINDSSALETIRAIQPKRYNYIDTITKGDKPVWGFIAQQVGSVLDYSTKKANEYIPNVFKRVTVTSNIEGSILSSESLDTSVFDLTKIDNNKLRLKIFIQQDNCEKMLEVTVKQITSTTAIEIEEQLDENITEAFVYGQQVNDFHILNKDAIFTVSVAALQEVDRQLQSATETIISQDQTIDALNQQLQDILARIVAI